MSVKKDKPYIWYTDLKYNVHFIIQNNITLYYRFGNSSWIPTKFETDNNLPVLTYVKDLSEEELFLELL